MLLKRYRGYAVAIYVKDTKRKQFTTKGTQGSAGASCCDICQRYKKKAIHNGQDHRLLRRRAVAIYVKDTKRKQFTTVDRRSPFGGWAVAIYVKDTKRKQFTT